MILETRQVHCPYCNEPIELAIEPMDGIQVYVEDCHVCCQPISVRVIQDEMSDNLSVMCTTTDEI
jgi:hypothetical protein